MILGNETVFGYHSTRSWEGKHYFAADYTFHIVRPLNTSIAFGMLLTMVMTRNQLNTVNCKGESFQQ